MTDLDELDMALAHVRAGDACKAAACIVRHLRASQPATESGDPKRDEAAGARVPVPVGRVACTRCGGLGRAGGEWPCSTCSGMGHVYPPEAPPVEGVSDEGEALSDFRTVPHLVRNASDASGPPDAPDAPDEEEINIIAADFVTRHGWPSRDRAVPYLQRAIAAAWHDAYDRGKADASRSSAAKDATIETLKNEHAALLRAAQADERERLAKDARIAALELELRELKAASRG